MSLINDMLRDLDQRRPTAEGQASTVQTVPPRRMPVLWVVVLTVITCAAMAAGGWWIFGRGAGDSGPGTGERVMAETALPTPTSFPRRRESTSEKMDSRLRGNDKNNIKTGDIPVGAATLAANNAFQVSKPEFRPAEGTQELDSGFRRNDESDIETASTGTTRLNKEAVANASSPAPSSESPAPRAESAPIKQPAVRTPDMLYREGRVALAQGNNTLAVERLTQALDKAPERHEIRLALMEALLQTGQFSTAVTVLNAGLQIAPAHLPFIVLHAKVLLRQNNARAALAALAAAPASVKQNLHSHAEYHALRAALLQRTAQYADAAALYKQLLEYNPHNSIWWSGLAISLDQSGHYPEALIAYRRALASGTLAPSLANYARQRVQALE